MKKIKFLKNITFDRKPIWYKDCIYDIIAETDDFYKLFSEDLQLRGIDKKLVGKFFEIIEK